MTPARIADGAQGIDVEVLSITLLVRPTAMPAQLIKVQNETLVDSARKPRPLLRVATGRCNIRNSRLSSLNRSKHSASAGRRSAACRETSPIPDFILFGPNARNSLLVFMHPLAQGNWSQRPAGGSGLLTNTIGNPLETTSPPTDFRGTLDAFPA